MGRLLLCKASGRQWANKAPGPQQGSQCLDRFTTHVSILHTRKLSLSKVKGVVRGLAGRMHSMVPHQVCVNASQHTRSPSAVTAGKPGANSRGELGLRAVREAEQSCLCSQCGAHWPPLSLIPVSGDLKHLLADSKLQ